MLFDSSHIQTLNGNQVNLYPQIKWNTVIFCRIHFRLVQTIAYYDMLDREEGETVVLGEMHVARADHPDPKWRLSSAQGH